MGEGHDRKGRIQRETSRLSELLSLGGVLLLEIVLTYFFLYQDSIRSSLQGTVNYDILFYIVFLLTVFLFCIGWHYLLGLWKRGITAEWKENKQREYILEGITYLSGMTVLGLVFVNEPFSTAAEGHYMPWHESRRTEILILSTAVWIAYELRRWRNREDKGAIHVGLKSMQVILALLAGWSMYQPNCFSQGTSLYHGDAYFNSVYRVLWMQPYTEINCGVYGFYGILLAPFTKLLGGDFRACVFALSILTFVSVLCYFYVLDRVVHSKWLQILGSIAIASTFISSWGAVYLQLWPHRFIFVGFVLAFIVWKRSSAHCEKKRWEVAGLGLLVLSLMWNLETGIGCVLASVGSDIVSYLQEYSLTSFIVWREIFLDILKSLISVCGAFLLVGIYNLCVGGEFISVKEFLFPFVNNPYVNYLNIEYPLRPSAWMLFLALLGLVICIVLWSTSLCGNGKKDEQLVYLAACAIAGAAQFAYYANRAVYGNLYIILPVAAIMMTFLVEYLEQKNIWKSHQLGNGIFRGAVVIQAAILILVVGMTFCKYMPLEVERDKGRDVQQVQKLMEMVSVGVPADTLGLGVGIPVLYSYLGWDTGFYAIDMADLDAAPAECKKYIYEVIENAEDIFIDESILTSLRENPQGIRKEDMEMQALTERAVEIIDDFYGTHEVQWSCQMGWSMYSYYKKV